jgi:hypothetical protein
LYRLFQSSAVFFFFLPLLHDLCVVLHYVFFNILFLTQVCIPPPQHIPGNYPQITQRREKNKKITALD